MNYKSHVHKIIAFLELTAAGDIDRSNIARACELYATAAMYRKLVLDVASAGPLDKAAYDAVLGDAMAEGMPPDA